MAGIEPRDRSERVEDWGFTAWNLRAAVHEFERKHISAVLTSAGGNKTEAARRLGIGLSSLYRKLDELGIAREEASQVVCEE